MPLFEQTVPIDHGVVAALLRKHWGLELGGIIKASQNHTFSATDLSSSSLRQFSVRVTPDPHKKHRERIASELQFVQYAAKTVPGVCVSVSPKNFVMSVSDGNEQPMFVQDGDLVVCVFQWAKGALLPFMEMRWMTDANVVHACGAWFAQLHAESRSFSVEFPDVVVQRWDDAHEGLLRGTLLHPDDIAAASDAEHFGVCHGDMNCSNFFFDDLTSSLSVFDWDQCQRAWYMWDVVTPLFTVVMLRDGGLPVAGDPVPEANPEAFAAALIGGY